MPEDDVWLEGKEKIFYIIPIAVVIMTGALWVSHPTVAFQIQETLEDYSQDAAGSLNLISNPRPALAEGDELSLNNEDIIYMNRIFRETTHETAYCGNLENREINVWKANTVNASETNIYYNAGNCPLSYDDVLVHTQPSDTSLSDTDKESFLDSPFAYSCVQAGFMSNDEGEDVSSFDCYSKEGVENINGTFEKVPVVAGRE